MNVNLQYEIFFLGRILQVLMNNLAHSLGSKMMAYLCHFLDSDFLIFEAISLFPQKLEDGSNVNNVFKILVNVILEASTNILNPKSNFENQIRLK